MTRIKCSAEEHRLKMIPDLPDCKHKSDLSINSHCRSATLCVRKRKEIEMSKTTRRTEELYNWEPIKRKNM